MRSNEMLTLGLLPDKKLDWRKFVLSYGLVLFIVFLMLMVQFVWPDKMALLAKYTVTEIVPRPDLIPEKPPVLKPQPRNLKPLPEAHFDTPKIVVPHELAKPKVEEARHEHPPLGGHR